MTWHAEQTKDRPDDVERNKLLKKREALVLKLEQRRAEGPATKSSSSWAHFREDLEAIAKKIVSIDKKLGR